MLSSSIMRVLRHTPSTVETRLASLAMRHWPRECRSCLRQSESEMRVPMPSLLPRSTSPVSVSCVYLCFQDEGPELPHAAPARVQRVLVREPYRELPLQFVREFHSSVHHFIAQFFFFGREISIALARKELLPDTLGLITVIVQVQFRLGDVQ